MPHRQENHAETLLAQHRARGQAAREACTGRRRAHHGRPRGQHGRAAAAPQPDGPAPEAMAAEPAVASPAEASAGTPKAEAAAPDTRTIKLLVDKPPPGASGRASNACRAAASRSRVFIRAPGRLAIAAAGGSLMFTEGR